MTLYEFLTKMINVRVNLYNKLSLNGQEVKYSRFVFAGLASEFISKYNRDDKLAQVKFFTCEIHKNELDIIFMYDEQRSLL